MTIFANAQNVILKKRCNWADCSTAVQSLALLLHSTEVLGTALAGSFHVNFLYFPSVCVFAFFFLSAR